MESSSGRTSPRPGVPKTNIMKPGLPSLKIKRSSHGYDCFWKSKAIFQAKNSWQSPKINIAHCPNDQGRAAESPGPKWGEQHARIAPGADPLPKSRTIPSPEWLSPPGKIAFLFNETATTFVSPRLILLRFFQ